MVPWDEIVRQAELSVAESKSDAASVRERYARAVLLLQAIAGEAEALNAALAADEITQKQARVRVQNIHGLAATPEVEEWEVERVG